MKVGIATNSIDKINGIKQAFTRFFQIEGIDVEVIHRSVDSGVTEQPFNEETYLGALNRVNNLIDLENADFYVSCEAGIEKFLGRYFNVQVVCIYDKKTQGYSFGKSAGWQIPSDDIEVIKNINLDTYLRNKGFNCLEDVLGQNYSRTNAIAQATEHALASKAL